MELVAGKFGYRHPSCSGCYDSFCVATTSETNGELSWALVWTQEGEKDALPLAISILVNRALIIGCKRVLGDLKEVGLLKSYRASQSRSRCTYKLNDHFSE